MDSMDPDHVMKFSVQFSAAESIYTIKPPSYYNIIQYMDSREGSATFSLTCRG